MDGWADDVVVLINADRLTGQIESVTDEVIRLRNPHLGEVVIPRKSVACFGPREKTAIPSLTATTAGSTNTWKNSLEFGFNLSEAEHNTRNLVLRWESHRDKKPSLLHLQALAFWGDYDGITTTQKSEGRAKYEHDWVRHWYWYNQLSAAYDRFRGLDLELQEGPGLGYRFLDTPSQNLAVEAGPNYLLRFETDHQRRQSFSLRAAQYYTWKINDRVSLNESAEFLQRTDDFAARQFRGELSLVMTLTRVLSLRLSLLDEYMTRPVLDTPENSLQFITSLGVTF